MSFPVPATFNQTLQQPIISQDLGPIAFFERIGRLPRASHSVREWKDIFDRFPILDSPAHHAIRAYFHWERFTPRYRNTGWKPGWEIQDLREGRPRDQSM